MPRVPVGAKDQTEAADYTIELWKQVVFYRNNILAMRKAENKR